MRNNNRITYRFDHKGQTVSAKSEKTDKPEIMSSLVDNVSSQVEEEMTLSDHANHANHKKTSSGKTGQASKSNVVPMYHSSSINMIKDINPWNSAVHDDIGALEQLIRETGQKKDNEHDGANSEKTVREPLERDDIKRRQAQVRGEQLNFLEPKLEKKSYEYMEWDSYADYDRYAEPMKDVDRKARHHTQHENHQAVQQDALQEDLQEDLQEGHPEGTRPINIEADEAYKSVNNVYGRYGTSSITSRRAAGPSWLNVFLSVTGALATGALFGYLLLSLFMGAKLWPGGGAETSDTAMPVMGEGIISTAPDSGSSITLDDVVALPMTGMNEESVVPLAPNGSNDGSSALPGGGKAVLNEPTISLTGLDQSYYMLQFGVFSTIEGRDAALGQLSAKGLASASMRTGETFRVYAGIASDKAQAAIIASQLTGLELYAKEVEVKSPSKLAFKGDAAIAQAFFEQSRDLITMWDELAVTQLEQPSLSPLSKVAAEAWQKEHKLWKEAATKMQAALTDSSGEAYGSQMIKAIDSAAASMLEYDKNPTRANLWSTQAAIMDVVLTQKEWFETSNSL